MILFQVESFDPSAPEGDSGPAKSQYLTKKDAYVILVSLVVLGICLIPVYKKLMDGRNDHLCKENLASIAKAMSLYTVQNDESLPPGFTTNMNGSPYLANGKPITWVTLLEPFMNPRSSFKCPTADESENVKTAGTSAGKVLESSYGMYLPYAGYPMNLISNPNDVILCTETSNLGAMESYDPKPYHDPSGAVSPVDGFVIGWDDGNDHFEAGKFVTRLAIRKTKNAEFDSQTAETRHSGGLYAITPGGNLKRIKSSDARITMLGTNPQGLWAVPVQFRSRR
ncbi:MAG: hypothetical protein JSS72_01320 [Armatimonadetes bacterium]|nr:hypothetical protein [Armatimonadota bacterium]